MTIVFLAASAERGGAETVLLDIVRALRSQRPGWSLHVIAGENGPIFRELEKLGIPAEVLPFGRLRGVGEQDLKNVGRTVKRLPHLLATAVGSVIWVTKLKRRLRKLRP